MNTAIIVNAKIIGNQTLEILEPIQLELNKIIKIIIEEEAIVPKAKRVFGFAKAMFEIEPDFFDPLPELKEYME